MVSSPHLWILTAKQWLLDQHTSLYRYQTSPVVLCIQNGDLRAKIARLYGSQTSPVNFCMQNSMPSTRMTSLYWSQPSSVVYACKTSTFGPAYKSLWVPDLTCRFVHAKHRENKKTILFAALTCGFVHAKQRLLDPNNKSLCVPEITCRFVRSIQPD